MSGVSVDTSGPTQADLDMRAAYEGGGNFMARLQQLADAKSQHDAALAELNLGRTAKDAFSDAKNKQEEAVGKLAEASAALDQARQGAVGTLAQAQKDAAGIVAAAKNIERDTVAAAGQTKAEADEYAAKVKADGLIALKLVTATQAAAEAKLKEAQDALAANQAATAAAKQAKAAADVLAAQLGAKIARINAAVGD